MGEVDQPPQHHYPGMQPNYDAAEGIDLTAVQTACVRQSTRPPAGILDMETYLHHQVSDESHREVLGPLLPGSGASGVVLYRGQTAGLWGDPDIPEMLFSVTKSVVSLVPAWRMTGDCSRSEHASATRFSSRSSITPLAVTSDGNTCCIRPANEMVNSGINQPR